MSRSALHVRPARPTDLPALVALAAELREALLPAPDLRPTSPAGRAVLEERLRQAIDDPGRRLVLVEAADGEPLGMALLTVSKANALVDVPALHMSHAVVDDRHKRRGAGRALVAAAAACAEELGLEQVIVSVRPGSRDANRFFARLGFAPLAVRRSASVAAIRRRLAHDEVAAGRVRRRPRRVPVAAALAPVPSRTAVPVPVELEP